MRILARLAAVAIPLAALAVPGLPIGAATVTPGAPLHVRWRAVARGAWQIAADDRYAYFTTIGRSVRVAGTLIDERSGKRRVLVPPACAQPGDPQFGGPWLMLQCSYGIYALFSLATGQWQSLHVSQACPGNCQAVAIGRDWLKLGSIPTPCGDHCSTAYYLENIRSGAVRKDPATPGHRIFDDLNASHGADVLCAPLRYPGRLNAAGRLDLGTITLHGRFAISAATRQGQTVYRLRRCRSRLNLRIPTSSNVVLASRTAVAWQADTQRFGVIFLPTLRRFSVSLPPMPPPDAGPAVASLTAHRLYVIGLHHQLWAAALPQP